MVAAFNPPLAALLGEIKQEFVFAQVAITRLREGYELRHLEDRAAAAAGLRLRSIPELRVLAQFSASGEFRPLKSAPNLQTGWRAIACTDSELNCALNHFYPGAVADWFAVQQGSFKPASYRDFTGRQTGMYRVTQLLNDAQATRAVASCCHRKFCLKRRLWSVEGLAGEDASDKSAIPCLEPCAILLEFARRVARIEQEKNMSLDLKPSELETVVAAIQTLLATGETAGREAEFAEPLNSRRLQLVLEKLRPVLEQAQQPLKERKGEQ